MTPHPDSATGRRRRLTFALATALGVYLFVELASCATYATLEGGVMPLAKFQAARDQRIQESAASRAFGKQAREMPHEHALHPYTGYVNAPGSSIKHYDDKMNRFGYAGNDDMFEIGKDDYVVAITGGSLAMRLFLDQRDLLGQEIARLQGLPSERVKVISLAMSGFKQPQPLMAVMYFLTLGGRIDLLLNVDGFNEVARLRKGLHPAYPTRWPRSVAAIANPEEILLVGRIAALDERRAQSAQIFSWLRLSASANLVWLVRDRAMDRETVDLHQRLDELNQLNMHAATFAQAGPKLADGVDLLDSSIDIWVAASIQLRRLALGNGFSYYHFLQPNQYLKGSKTLSKRERKKAVSQADKWSDAVNRGYPKLRAREPELERAGVDYADLSDIFRSVEETVYLDSCCHLNSRGAELLARAIVARISADPERSAPSSEARSPVADATR